MWLFLIHPSHHPPLPDTHTHTHALLNVFIAIYHLKNLTFLENYVACWSQKWARHLKQAHGIPLQKLSSTMKIQHSWNATELFQPWNSTRDDFWPFISWYSPQTCLDTCYSRSKKKWANRCYTFFPDFDDLFSVPSQIQVTAEGNFLK